MGNFLTHCVSSSGGSPQSRDIPAPRPSSVPISPNHNGTSSASSETGHRWGSQQRQLPMESGSLASASEDKERSDRRQSSPEVSLETKIDAYFARYKDEEEDRILADGVECFCSELSVDPTEFVVLAIAWKFEADEMCAFSRREFVGGCRRLGVYSPETLRGKFDQLELEAVANFKDLYRFTFGFGLDKSMGQRSLPLAIAIPLWRLVYSRGTPSAMLDSWCAFLETNQVKGIPRDTWNMFLPFSQAIHDDFSNYDDSEAWPSLFDDFVEYQRAARSVAADNRKEGELPLPSDIL
eukprot:m.308498 g.308498  ORF g.308498 m.308498 type:complete len:295 (+) comp44118_c0_seq1:107-991(+)